jgi:hypothetical protein
MARLALMGTRSPFLPFCQKLVNFVLRSHKREFRELCSRLLTNPQIPRSGLPGAVVGVPFDLLARRCRGTDVLTERFRMQKPGSGFDDIEIEISLGDAFGADIDRPESYSYVRLSLRL